jgi:GntR family transcriptional regulator
MAMNTTSTSPRVRTSAVGTRKKDPPKPAGRKLMADLGAGSLPLYKKIKLEITRTLSSGEVEPGVALPTEEQIASRFGISVGTVRRAMSELVSEKILVRQQGRGTFLAPFSPDRMLNSFWHIVRKDDVREVPIVQTLRFEEIPSDAPTAARLGIRPGDPIYWIVNLMLMGGNPVLVDHVRISRSLFPRLTKSEFVARDTTIYGLYQNRFRISVVKTVDQLNAVPADLDTAKKLGLALATPLLEIVRVAYTFNERPVEFRRSLLYTENYEFRDITGGPSSS